MCLHVRMYISYIFLVAIMIVWAWVNLRVILRFDYFFDVT